MTTIHPIDHFARVNERREAMLREWSDKEQALLKKIAGLKQEALDLRGDADKLARSHHIQKSNEARGAATQAEETVRKLTNIDLVRLRAEQNTIRMNQHPELA
jgi:hypothetical protein